MKIYQTRCASKEGLVALLTLVEMSHESIDIYAFDMPIRMLLYRVMPRLSRLMETGGRKIGPTLIHTLVHGNLRHGNVATSTWLRKAHFFDLCALYAHNE